MNLLIIAFCCYFFIVILFGISMSSKSKHISKSRSINYWVTAISAHASDMSAWLFMGLPAATMIHGLSQIFVIFGLSLFMYLNWQFISKKLRIETEKYKCFSITSLFINKYKPKNNLLYIISCCSMLLFFTIYISSGLVGIGLIFENIFSFSYSSGIIVSSIIILIYTLFGGYEAISWTDFFQGIFLFFVIIIVPIIFIKNSGGITTSLMSAKKAGFSFELFNGKSLKNLLLILSWGLGYFGQPHILGKFMGIKNHNQLKKAKILGLSWQSTVLIFSMIVGMVGLSSFKNLDNYEMIFVKMTQSLFSPFSAGIILCAILSATISTIDSQIIILANTFTEDIYSKLIRKNPSTKEVNIITRIFIILSTFISIVYAINNKGSVYHLVHFAWNGLGASFGPAVIFALYSKNINATSILIGVVSGSISSIVFNNMQLFDISPLIPSFFLSSALIYIHSLYIQKKLLN